MKIILGCIILFLQSCAVLHHAQFGEMDDRHQWKRTPIDIKISEIGVSTDDLRAISRGFKSKEADQALAILQLFQMGPRTGNPTYVEDYAREIYSALKEACPNGVLKNVVSIREMRKYPVISGEIIKVTGDCLTKI